MLIKGTVAARRSGQSSRRRKKGRHSMSHSGVEKEVKHTMAEDTQDDNRQDIKLNVFRY